MRRSRWLLAYLADRAGVALLAYAITGALLALTGLVLSYEGLPARLVLRHAGYGFLLASTLLAIYLGADLAGWAPHARQTRALLEQDLDLTALNNLPPGGTLDQRTARELLEKLHGLAVAEKFRYAEGHRQHLAFINLWVHQMKTPVSAIHLTAQGLQEHAPEAAASIDEETARLSEGLEMVLTMARLQDFALDFHVRRTDLRDGVRNAINRRKKQFIRLGVYPEIEANEADWTALTDPKWNDFVLDQIIGNALKYGSQARAPGSPAQRLRVRLHRAPGAIQIAIADEGPGIPLEDLPRVFEPFFTGENGRRYADATGIGLWLVRQVVDRLGHQIEIASTVGKGTSVTLTYLSNP